MQSTKRVESLDLLELDLQLTPEDNEKLWRVRELNRMDSHQYLAFLLAFTKDHPPSRETSEGWEPFKL